MANPGAPAQAVIARSKSEQGVQRVMFPSDLGDYFMSFDFYDYRTLNDLPQKSSETGGSIEYPRNIYNANKQNVKDQIAQKSSFAQIALPLPASLVDQFNVQWETTQMGLAGGILGELMQGGTDLYNKLPEEFKASAAQLSESAGGALRNIPGGDVGGQLGARALLSGIGAAAEPLNGLSQGLGSDLVDLSTGIMANPNLAVLFRGPTLKQHQFSWKFSPRSAEESQNVARIIAIFKRAMHPQKLNPSTTAFLKYPSECLAEFHGGATKNFLYPLRPCVVEDFSINYAPNGMPSFFQDTNKEVSLEISVKLQETSYYLRDSFDNEEEFGSDGFQTSDLLRNPTGTDEEPDV